MEPTTQLETCLPNQCQEGGRHEPTAAPAIGGPALQQELHRVPSLSSPIPDTFPDCVYLPAVARVTGSPSI